MANKNYPPIHSLPSANNNSRGNHSNNNTSNTISFVLTPTNNSTTSTTLSSSTTTTTPSLRTLQIASTVGPFEIYSPNNNRLNSVVTQQPIFNKLLSETIKEEYDEATPDIISEQYALGNSKINLSNSSRTATNGAQHQPPVITAVRLNPREATNGLTVLSMAMTNASGHHMSTMNPAHLQDGSEPYFVTGLNSDLSSYKIPQTSNSNLPSPSSSSNSSNPPSSSHHHHHHHHNHQPKREGGDPTRKREMRLQKNREAARECRRKKKEYIKCLEERVTGLENQNKALIEELRQLKELYCQREETNNNNNKTTTSTR